jgi:hypothetical protein
MLSATIGAFSLLLLAFGRRVEFVSDGFDSMSVLNNLPMDYSELSTLSHVLCPDEASLDWHYFNQDDHETCSLEDAPIDESAARSDDDIIWLDAMEHFTIDQVHALFSRLRTIVCSYKLVKGRSSTLLQDFMGRSLNRTSRMSSLWSSSLGYLSPRRNTTPNQKPVESPSTAWQKPVPASREEGSQSYQDDDNDDDDDDENLDLDASILAELMEEAVADMEPDYKTIEERDRQELLWSMSRMYWMSSLLFQLKLLVKIGELAVSLGFLVCLVQPRFRRPFMLDATWLVCFARVFWRQIPKLIARRLWKEFKPELYCHTVRAPVASLLLAAIITALMVSGYALLGYALDYHYMWTNLFRVHRNGFSLAIVWLCSTGLFFHYESLTLPEMVFTVASLWTGASVLAVSYCRDFDRACD